MEYYDSEMLSLLKKKGKRLALSRTLIIFLAIAGYLFYSDFALLKFLSGPIPLEEISVADYKNQYVITEMSLSLGAYMDTVSTDADTKISTTVNSDYLIPTNENKLMGVSLTKAELETANQIVNETYDWLNEVIEYPSTTLEIKGTIQEIPADEWFYLKSFMEYLQYPPEEIDAWATPYVIKHGNIGKLNKNAVIFSAVLAAAMLLFAVYTLARAFTGSYQKSITNYLDINPAVSLKTLESDFAGAALVGKEIWVGNRWMIYLDGATAKIADNKETVWAYFREHTVINRGIPQKYLSVELFDINKKQRTVKVKKKADADEILQLLAENHSHIVIGYSTELENCFKKEFDKFLTISYSPQPQE